MIEIMYERVCELTSFDFISNTNACLKVCRNNEILPKTGDFSSFSKDVSA